MSQVQPVLTFDGIDDYIEVPYGEKLNPQIFTISCWAKPTNVSPMVYFLISASDRKQHKVGGYSLMNNSTHSTLYYNWWVWMRDATTPYAAKYIDSLLIVASNIWTHLAVTFDGKKAKLYVNGQATGEVVVGYTAVNTSGIYIGAGHDLENAPYYFFKGQIAEVCMWNKARTQQEIKLDMKTRLTGKEAGLVGYWPLNEGSGTTATDKTSNGNNGIIKGATWSQEEIDLKPIEPTTGEFQVPTNSATGFEFTNSQTKDISYKFTPSGTWKPKSDFEDFTAAGLKGLPPGYQAPYLEALKPYQQYLKYQNNTFFCLVAVNKTTGVVTEVGQETAIVLKPGETLTFVVNDLTVDYTDNTGTLTVKWSAT